MNNLPIAANYQNNAELVNAGIGYIELKAIDAKKTVEELLYMLDMQEKVPWSDMLEMFSSLANTMSQLQGALKKSAIQSGAEDHGILLRSHVLVPQRLQLEVDPQLQQMTSHRVHSWNHDVVPDYLRTKLNPDMESEEALIEADKSGKAGDMISRQIGHLNKHADCLLTGLQSSDRAQTENYVDKPTHDRSETVRIVRAIVCGDGLRTSRTAGPSTQQQMPQQQQQRPINPNPIHPGPGGAALPR